KLLEAGRHPPMRCHNVVVPSVSIAWPFLSTRLSNSPKGTYHGHAFSVQSISHPRRNLNGQNTLGPALSFAVRNGGGSARALHRGPRLAGYSRQSQTRSNGRLLNQPASGHQAITRGGKTYGSDRRLQDLPQGNKQWPAGLVLSSVARPSSAWAGIFFGWAHAHCRKDSSSLSLRAEADEIRESASVPKAWKRLCPQPR